MKNELYQVIDQLAIEGLKVIGCGYKSISESQAQSTLSEQYDFNEIENKVIFAGFVCLNDPPRPEVINAIADCKTAGIEVLMITGDHPNAALAIGKQINLVDQNETKTLTGLEIDKLNDDELSNRLEDTRILARVSPEHKLRVVQSLQRKGEIVAMTGDGVNDAPALRQADIGVAMGMSGTEAATEAADLILTDDNFATLVRAIEEGRSIQANIRKFIGYLLASNTGEVLLLIMTVFIIGFFAPSLIVELSVLNESQILYMNLVTDTFLAIAIGLERKNSSIMNYPPRNPKEPIIGRKTFLSIIYTGTYVGIINLGFFLLLLGEPSNWVNLTSKEIAYAQTMTMSLIIFMETFIALSYRSSESIFTMSIFSNRVFLLSFGLVYILHFILLYTPFFQILFKLVPLSLTDLIILFVISLVALVMEEFRKKVISS
jgi:Ca2+-transporting ATPase